VRLKSVDISGFKTFAEKTRLEFTPGITAIVGPNGSGKSNIADAVVWALGETSLKSLRSSRAQDIIFAGTDSRKPLGLAEVCLTLDNEDSSLPVEFPEVSITRRVFRSGEGEYMINRAPSRLRDIQEMLLDTGVGKAAYSIVSQLQIDSILSLRGEDRRELFEEAAGVQKYRQRRNESERRLEATRQNLLRLADVITELESQLPHFREQVERAQKHKALSDELAEIARDLLLCQAHDHNATRERIVRREQDGLLELETARNQQQASQQLVGSLTEKSAQLEQDLERQQAACSALSSRANEADRTAALASERLASLESRRNELLHEIESLKAGADSTRADLAREKETRQHLRRRATELEEHNQGIAPLGAIWAGLVSSIEEAQQECRWRHLDLVHALADTRNRLSQAESLRRAAEASLERLGAQARDAKANLVSSEARLADLRGRIESLSEELRSARVRMEALQEERQRAAQVQQDSERQANELLQQVSALASRLAAIEEMSAQVFSPGSAAIMRAAQEGLLPDRFALIRDIVKARPEFERAVEAVLDSRLDHVIASDEGAALSAVDFLSRTSGGRTTVWLTQAESKELRPDSIARGIECSPEYRATIEHLLEGAVMAPDRNAALSLLRSGEAACVVTPEGEVFHRHAISGGTAPPLRLAWTREIEELRAEISEKQSLAEQALSKAQAARDQGDHAASEIDATARRIGDLQTSLAAAEQALSSGEPEGGRLREALEGIEQEGSRLENEHTQAQHECGELQGEIERRQAQVAAAETTAQSLEQAASSAPGELLSHLSSALALETAGLQAQLLSSARGSGQRQRALLDALSAYRVKSQAAQSLSAQLESLAAERDAATGVSAEATQALEAGRQELETLQRLRQTTSKDLASTHETIQQQSAQIQEIHDSLSSLQVRRASLEAEISFVSRSLRSEHSLSLEQALAIERPKRSRAAAQARSTELRQEIEAMGPVNPAAEADLGAIENRMNDLQAQKQDAEKAQEDLLRIISEIESAAQEMFLETFRAVQVAFQDVFRRLFDGGETELSLTDPEHPLEGGVDVHVTLPGKRRQNLLLLSGGERAMTALALVLSLIKVRPSPFVILDEVDAPLDDANVGRYASLLREWADKTQFIIITHNRGSMEAADTLHGITMEHPGVSKLVSVRLEEWKSPADQEEDA